MLLNYYLSGDIMEITTKKFTMCLTAAIAFLAFFTPVAFSEDNLPTQYAQAGQPFSYLVDAIEGDGQAGEAKHASHRQHEAGNNYAELVGLLKQMNRRLENLSGGVAQAQPVAIRTSTPSRPSAKRGKAIFHEMQCISCHGVNGKGHEAKTNMKDERGLHIMAADLTQPSSFGNGNTRKDIFRTVMTGLDGSPMPSFVDLFVGEEDRAWDLIEYVYSLQEDTLARFLP